MSKFYSVRLEAVQIIVLDAKSEEEAIKLALQNPDGMWNVMDAVIEGRDLTPDQVDREIQHGAFDLRE